MTFDAVSLKAIALEAQTGPFGSQLHSEEYIEGGTPVVNPSNIRDGRIIANSAATVTAETVERLRMHKIRPGDLLFGRRGELGRSVVVSHKERGWLCGTGSIRVRLLPGKLDPSFAGYALQSAEVRSYFERSAVGSTMGNLNTDIVLGLRVPVPVMEEQVRIAEFLDVETSRIDRLRKARQDQISLLEERTKGLIFDGIRGSEERNRRASGLAWLGSLPIEWTIMPVGFQFEVLLGKMLNQESGRGSDLAPYLRNTNVQWDRITTDDLLLMNFPPEEHQRYAVRSGDLLVCEGGEPGRAAVWDGRVSEIYYQKALHRVRPRGYSSPRWLFYCLRAATTQNVFAVEGNATTISHLTGEQLRAHRFPFPRRSVQDRLVAQLDREALRQADLNAALHRQLTLLAERRQALITAAVTGQFDVSTASGRNVTDGVQP
ncbi:restriction endonuclease subunit S [Streptomyces niveus]|uniref:restriction endonuclease subunit S n=1 Tax=Streptomyces niveus TaxID=193462 RepID=UPI003428D37B